MPNWCSNTLLIITGSRDEYREIKEIMTENANGDRVFSFDWFYPMPKNKNDWHQWCVSKWGTKWDTVDSYVHSEFKEFKNGDFLSDKLEYGGRPFTELTFQTAWSPPIPFFEYMSKKYPSTIFCFEYEEFGEDYAGVKLLRNSEILFDKSWRPSSYCSDGLCEDYYDLVPACVARAVESVYDCNLPEFHMNEFLRTISLD